MDQICHAMGHLCIPLAGRRILELRQHGASSDDQDDIVIELELCIGLLFKPIRHHIKSIVSEGMEGLLSLWTPILEVLGTILNEAGTEMSESEESEDAVNAANRILKSSNDLTLEHLRNVVMVLISYNILKAEPLQPNDISDITWSAVSGMQYCKSHLDEWKQAASQQ